MWLLHGMSSTTKKRGAEVQLMHQGVSIVCREEAEAAAACTVSTVAVIVAARLTTMPLQIVDPGKNIVFPQE